VFQLDAEAGVVRFGIKLARVRAGGGGAGNVPAGTLATLDLSAPPVAKLKVWQPLDAGSGEDAETLREAELRIPKLLRHRERAVTAEDYRELALVTPGVRVGRVEVLPRFKPQQRRFDVPGVVSVMALPARQSLEPPYPRVDRPFIEAVYGQLDPRKPLGVELYVIGCEYLPIAISVGIDNPSGQQQIFADVEQALRRYLFSLAPGGPDSTGWPLGRTVRRRELEVVVSRLPGVAGVYGPNLFSRDEQGAWRKVAAADGNESAEIALEPWMLPELISVVVASGAAPDELKPQGPTTSEGGVAVPVVPEVC
jgi:predicted phage baseplate assembly protein